MTDYDIFNVHKSWSSMLTIILLNRLRYFQHRNQKNVLIYWINGRYSLLEADTY